MNNEGSPPDGAGEADLAQRMEHEAVTVLGPLPDGDDYLARIETAATASTEKLRAAIAACYHDAIDLHFATRRDHLVRYARDKGADADAEDVVGSTREHLHEIVNDFAVPTGRFAGPNPENLTPAQNRFVGWVENQIWAKASEERRRRAREKKLRERLAAQERLALPTQGAVSRPDSERPRPIGPMEDDALSDVEEAIDTEREAGGDDRRDVLGALRHFLRAARRMITDALASPDIRASRGDRPGRHLRRVKASTLLFVNHLLDTAPDPDESPGLVEESLRLSVASEAGSRDQLDQEVKRTKASALFAAAGLLRIACATLGRPGHVPAWAWDKVVWWLCVEHANELQLAQVAPVTKLLSERITGDGSRARFAADADWLDELLTWLGTETSPDQQRLAAKPALEYLESPLQSGSPSPLERAAEELASGGSKAFEAQALIDVSQRLRAIVEGVE